MSRVWALLAAALLVSVAGQWAGATTADRRVTMLYAALGALALVAAGIAANIRAWRSATPYRTPSVAPARHVIAATNARLIGIAWMWGAASMLAVYLFSGLKWQHGWQYGCGMALIGVAVLLYARQLTVEGLVPGPPPSHAAALGITALQSVAATVALLWLVFSGKLYVDKPDWAANAVFVAGGIALVVLSDLAVAVNARLDRRSR